MADSRTDTASLASAGTGDTDSSAGVQAPPSRPRRQVQRFNYLAYGSDMQIAYMARTCPNSRYIGRATLTDYKWHVNKLGFANITKVRTAHAPGLVFEVDEDDLARLEINKPPLYKKVVVEGELYPAPFCLYRRLTAWITERGGPAAVLEEAYKSGRGNDRRTSVIEKNLHVFLSADVVQDGRPDARYAEAINLAAADAMALGIDAVFFEKIVQQFMPGRLLPHLRTVRGTAASGMRHSPSPSPTPSPSQRLNPSPSSSPGAVTRRPLEITNIRSLTADGGDSGSGISSGAPDKRSGTMGRDKSPTILSSRRGPWGFFRRQPALDTGGMDSSGPSGNESSDEDDSNRGGKGKALGKGHGKSQSESISIDRLPTSADRPLTPVITVSPPSSKATDKGISNNAGASTSRAALKYVPKDRTAPREKEPEADGNDSPTTVLRRDTEKNTEKAKSKELETGPTKVAERKKSKGPVTGQVKDEEKEEGKVPGTERIKPRKVPSDVPTKTPASNVIPTGIESTASMPTRRQRSPPEQPAQPAADKKQTEMQRPIRRCASFGDGRRQLSRFDRFLQQAAAHPHFSHKAWVPAFRVKRVGQWSAAPSSSAHPHRHTWHQRHRRRMSF